MKKLEKIMRIFFITTLVLLISFSAYSQESNEIDNILKVIGVGSLEEVSEDELEHFEFLLRHPLEINTSGISELLESGLFSSFQAAALTDYIDRHGYILSMTELSAVDGFNQDKVVDLKPFISLETPSNIKKSNRLRVEASVRGGYKAQFDTDVEHFSMGAMKFRIVASDMFAFSLSASKSYDLHKFKWSCLGGNMTWNHRCGKVLIGDFNLRLGQGLSLWNTMVVGNRTSPTTLMKKPSGLSASYSFTGTSVITGLAADVNLKKWKITCGLFFPKLKSINFTEDRFILNPIVNLQRQGRIGHVAFTHHTSFSVFNQTRTVIPHMKSSVDFAICLRGINIYGESAYEWSNSQIGFVLGSDFDVVEALRLGLLCRYDPLSEQHGATLAGEFIKGNHSGKFSVDAVYYTKEEKYPKGRGQLTLQTHWHWHCCPFFEFKVRATERMRTWGEYFRTDLRTDVFYLGNTFTAGLRLNCLKCKSFAVLAYAEAGYKSKVISLYMRQGFFFVDNWDDRIYVYERDAPGNFNVPAFYGRGVWTSAYLSYKIMRWGSLYFRMSYQSYPFMKVKKPGKAELKFMFNVRF